MATQQSIVFAETIRAMKLAMRRHDNDSDSDESIQQPTNRGNKLKRNAANVCEGRLDTTGGCRHKRKVEHAGYQRYIIQTNPLRYDGDGDLVDDDEDPDDPSASPAQDNPWGETRLEELLAPLTSAAELADHPSLAVPFTSKALTEMAGNARENLHRERHVLWRVKQLLLRFRGDEPWVPLGNLETEHDLLLLDPNALATTSQSVTLETDHSVNGSAGLAETHIHHPADASNPAASASRVVPNGSAHTDAFTNGIKTTDMHIQDQPMPDSAPHDAVPAPPRESNQEQPAPAPSEDLNMTDNHEMTNADTTAAPTPNDPEPPSPTDSSTQTQHRMTTRARARTPPSPAHGNSPSPSPAPSSILPVHGFFNIPSLALPDRDFGLSTTEAEDTRRLLILFVQKQEQVVREAEHMLEGLLKADRMRKEVYHWCNAEGHVGELSDGEDWYDGAEWGLDADLVKGKEEEEVEEEGRGKSRRRRGAQH